MELSLTEKAAVVRTRLALERTLMAWQRTALALIGFGFTFYKGVQFLVSHRPPEEQQRPLSDARVASATLILVGLVSLVAAFLQHSRHIALVRQIDPELPKLSIALVVSAVLALMGLAALVFVIVQR